MAPRRDRADVVEVEPTADEFSEVDTPAETDDPETSPDGETVETSKKAEKAEKARGDLKEGWVTPVGLAKVLSQPRDGNKDNLDPANWYHTGVKNPSDHEVRPQMVYSYKKNAPKEDPFPSTIVTDSLGHEREALLLQDGLDWWERKNKRVAERKANAAEKDRKKAEAAAKRAAAAPAESEAAAETESEAVEAE